MAGYPISPDARYPVSADEEERRRIAARVASPDMVFSEDEATAAEPPPDMAFTEDELYATPPPTPEPRPEPPPGAVGSRLARIPRDLGAMLAAREQRREANRSAVAPVPAAAPATPARTSPPLGAMPYPRRAAARERLSADSANPSPTAAFGGRLVGESIAANPPTGEPIDVPAHDGPLTGPEAVAHAAQAAAGVKAGDPRAAVDKGAAPTGPRITQNVTGTPEQQLVAQLERHEAQAGDERTRMRRMGITALALAPFAPGMSQMVSAGRGLVNDEGRRGVADTRREIAEALERREAERARERQEMLDALEQRNKDREFAFDQSEAARDAGEFQQREAQDMKERVLQIEGADRRSRRHSNAMVGRDPDSGVSSGPRANPDGTPETPEQADARVSADLDRFRARDREFVDYTAAVLEESGVDIDTPEGRAQLRDYVAPYANLLGQVSGRRGRERNAALGRMGSAEGRRGRLGDADRNQFQRQLDSLADDVETHRNAAAQASSAAAALRRLVSAAGSQGAAILRDGGDLATILARVEGPEVEAARAQFANYLGSLLHERGGTAVTPTEEQRILASIAAGNMAISPEATIRMLQGIAARASEREQFYIRNADPAVRDEFLRRQGGGAPATEAAPSNDGHDLRVGGHYMHNGRRLPIRTQEQLEALRQRLGGGG
jgi:hypothetical protein